MPKTVTKKLTEIVCLICGKNFGEANDKNIKRADKCEGKHKIKELQKNCKHYKCVFRATIEYGWEFNCFYIVVDCKKCGKQITRTVFDIDEALKMFTQEQLKKLSGD